MHSVRVSVSSAAPRSLPRELIEYIFDEDDGFHASIQPQNELTTLVGKCGNHYLYRNNYTLPLGFMMDEGVIDAWKPYI